MNTKSNLRKRKFALPVLAACLLLIFTITTLQGQAVGLQAETEPILNHVPSHVTQTDISPLFEPPHPAGPPMPGSYQGTPQFPLPPVPATRPGPATLQTQLQQRFGPEIPPGWQKLLEQEGRLPQVFEDILAPASPTEWGGPDAFGYTYADSNESWGPAPTFEDISGIGTAVTFSDAYYTATLPFPFPYYGNTHTQVYLYGDCLYCYGDWTHLAFGAPDPYSYGAVYWMDWMDRDSGAVYVYSDTLSSPARFIVQYDNVWNYSYGITTTSQVILYENGDILVRYATDFSWWGWWYGSLTPRLYSWYGNFVYGGYPQNDLAVLYEYPDGVWFWPPVRNGGGPVGGLAAYTFDLHNNTGASDSFTLTVSSNVWPVTISPTQTGAIPDGGVMPIMVTVDVSDGATPGDADTAVIQATSVSNPSLFDTATANTTAVCSPALTFSGQSTWANYLDDTYDYGGQMFTYLYLNAHTTSGWSSMNATVEAYDPNLSAWQTLAQWQYVGPNLVLVDQFDIPPVYDALRIQLNDNWGYQVYYEYQFIVCREATVSLTPAAQTSVGHAGATMVYTQTVTNYTMGTDSFNLTAAGNAWPTTFWNGNTQITTTGLLADLAAFTFTVRVAVPPDAEVGDSDQATVQVTSVTYPTISDTASLQTNIVAHGWAQSFSEPWAADGTSDDEHYLDLMRPGGIIPVQMTNDFDWSWQPPAVAAYPREYVVSAWRGTEYWNGTTWVNDLEYTAYNAEGTQVLTITQVTDNASATLYTVDYNPVLAVAPTNGNVFFSWQRYEDDWLGNWGYNVYYAVHGPNGNELLGPTALTTNITYTVADYSPTAADFSNGGFAVAWQHDDYATSITDIYYAILDNTGSLLAGPVNLTNYTQCCADYVTANRLPDGNVLLTWRGPDGSLYYAVLDSAGNLALPASILPAQSGNAADAVGLRNGKTIVAWWEWVYIGPYWQQQIVYTVLSENYTIIMPAQILPNTQWGYALSLARDYSDNAVFTWRNDSATQMFYALVDNEGAVLTEPIIFRLARGNGLRMNEQGTSNGSLPEPVLNISKTATVASVEPGDLITYTLMVENNGYANATGVTITDTLPADTTFVSASNDGTLVAGQVQWTGLTVNAGGSLNVSFVVQVSASAPEGSTITNDDYGVKSVETLATVTGTAVVTPVIIEERHTYIYLPIIIR